jgi:hypothetical protein
LKRIRYWPSRRGTEPGAAEFDYCDPSYSAAFDQREFQIVASASARLTAVLIAFAASSAVPFAASKAQSITAEVPNSDPTFDSAFADLPPVPADPKLAVDPSVIAEVAPARPPSAAAARVIDWVVASHDNGDLPFAVIDKDDARLLVFDPVGQLLGDAPVLVGVTRGDDSAPGVGDRELQDIPVAERTTPAGRFVAKFGPAAGHKEDVIWVDFRDAISLHPVITTKPKERRLARLQSATPTDNRITFGCINVGHEFYSKIVEPAFLPAGAIVYILPETRSLHDVFAGISADDPGAPPRFDAVFASYQVGENEAAVVAPQ